MSSKIYVGNLPYSVTDSTLESNFAEFGSVSSAKVMMDRETGRSKGFGFVEMASAEVAQAAITGAERHVRRWTLDRREPGPPSRRGPWLGWLRRGRLQGQQARGRWLWQRWLRRWSLLTPVASTKRPAQPVFFRSDQALTWSIGWSMTATAANPATKSCDGGHPHPPGSLRGTSSRPGAVLPGR